MPSVGKKRLFILGVAAPKIESVVTTTVLGLNVGTAAVPGVLRSQVIREFFEECGLSVSEGMCYEVMHGYATAILRPK